MSRWFRHYAGMMRDEKLVRAALMSKQPVERVVWVWGAILESAAEVNDGGRFSVDYAEMAYFLRADMGDIVAIADALDCLGRLCDGAVAKWGDRQFQSDLSAERQRRYRERKGRGDNDGRASGDGEVTAASRHRDVPETETETETEKKDSEANASGADAPAAAPVYLDSVHELWGEGIPILESLGVKKPRPIVGRWLRDAKNDAQKVLGAIQRARDARVVDPVPWITRSISTGGNVVGKPGKGGFADALGRLREAEERLRDEGGIFQDGPPALRLISDR
jgi:hypothetical protein